MIHWTVLSVAVALGLWLAGRAQPSVARRRMQMLSLASAAITLALVVGVAARDPTAVRSVVTAALSALAATGFLLALAPPRSLRTIWRRPEQERLQDAVAGLISATDERQVVERVLPAAGDLVGARRVVLVAPDGDVIGEYEATLETRRSARSAGSRESEAISIDVAPGKLVVETSPYSPFFGRDEVALLRTLGALIGLALDRTRLFAQEREARAALQRADALEERLHRAPRARAAVARRRRQRAGGDPVHARRRVPERPASAATVPEDLTATVDPNAFDRIVGNLIVNALRVRESSGDGPRGAA